VSGDIESAFVEIAAGEPDVTHAAERLVPLYEDAAAARDPVPEVPDGSRLRGFSRVVLAVVLVPLVVAGVYLLLLFAVWLGDHGILTAPN
jgi:hypothetical protein